MGPFGEKIYRLRRERGLTQEKLAEKLDVSRQTVYKWETDRACPTMEKLVEISKLFQVPMSVFFEDEHALSEPPSEEVPKEADRRSDQSVSSVSHWGKIILLSVILLVAILIFTLLLIILGTGVFPLDQGDHLSFAVGSSWYFSPEFIFWTIFCLAIVIVGVLIYLIVRLALKRRKSRRLPHEEKERK